MNQNRSARPSFSPLRREHRRPSALLLAAAVVGMTLVPSALEAQRPGGRRGGGPMMGSSIAFLLEKAEDLGLTPEQTEQFTALQAQFQKDNAPIREKMAELRGGGDREAMREVMMEMRDNDRAAIEKALPLLDDAQQVKAKAMLEERRGNRRRPGGD